MIKTINLEGVRVVGDPQEFAARYYADGIDEILYLDAVASLYGRNHLVDLITYTAANVFVPITVGGGVRSVDDVRSLLASGADKVAINTAATERPQLINEVAARFGSQCMVLQLDAKRRGNSWEVYRDGGREHTDLDACEWAIRAQELGAGEILLTSIDNEGKQNGFDVDLVRAITDIVTIPVIVSGGMGTTKHMIDVVARGNADAVAMAHVLHYETLSLSLIRQDALDAGLTVRTPEGST